MKKDFDLDLVDGFMVIKKEEDKGLPKEMNIETEGFSFILSNYPLQMVDHITAVLNHADNRRILSFLTYSFSGNIHHQDPEEDIYMLRLQKPGEDIVRFTMTSEQLMSLIQTIKEYFTE